LTLAGLVGAVSAQQSGFKRTILQQSDISIPDHEAVTGITEINAGASVGRHSHHGEEVGYVIEGILVIEQDGQPARTFSAGQAFLIPAETVHNATNRGMGAARILATYIVEKGKPLATPAPPR
jgi:quercetin dioxygenase-like cupin family protein